MIIDIHTHIIKKEWLPAKWWQWLGKYYEKSSFASLFKGHKKEDFITNLCDPDGQKLINRMNETEIDKSVVLPLDWGILMGEPPQTIQKQNEEIAHIVQKSNGRLIAFAGIDPRRKNAVDTIDFFLKHHNMQGIKLYPAAGYDIEEKKYYAIFEKACEYNIPVLIHTGYSFGPFYSKYSTPLKLDTICADFPQAKIIAAHLGNGFSDDLCMLGHSKDNLYCDFSLMQVHCKHNYKNFARIIRKSLNFMGLGKVFFGTDWPFSEKIIKTKKFITLIQNLANIKERQESFASIEIEAILGNNAKKLLNL